MQSFFLVRACQMQRSQPLSVVPCRQLSISATVHTPIADRRRCEPKAIQSAVRRAAKGAWLTNPEYVQQLAGYPLTGAPSAVQFIEMLYNALVRAV